MRTIYKTDNAFVSIDKINGNFEELAGADSKTVAQGILNGAGMTFVFGYVNAYPGDVITIQFPGGDFSTPASGVYGKLSVGYRDNADVIHPLFLCRGNNPVQSQYDIFISSALGDDYKDLYIAIRANNGVSVPYVVTRRNQEIKQYFRKELAETIAQAKARITNDNCLVFPLITDIHYRSSNEYDAQSIAPYLAISSGDNMAEIGRQIRFDNVVCLGDIIDGFNSTYLAKADSNDMMHIFSGVDSPLLNVLGNHDDNRYGDGLLTENEIYASFLRNIDERVIRGPMNGANWYRDIEQKKIRIIGLCAINYSGDYDYTTETQNWFTETLNSLPEDYKSIILLHVPPVNAQTFNGSGYRGGTEIANIINTYTDKIIAVFQGHTHLDNVFVSPYLAISTSCNKCYNPESITGAPEDSVFPERSTGTESEDLFEIVVCDTENNLLSCIRFGAGVNRYINYLPISVSAGGTVTLTPNVISPSSWTTRASESQYISINNGVVSISSSAVSGSRLIARASDASGNMEIWIIKVS